MQSFIFGKSAQGLPITGYRFGTSGPRVLILGGVHGDETEGVYAAYGLLKEFAKSFAYRLQLTLVPEFNIDGVLAKTRKNGHGIDLNRNLPSKDWTNEVKEPRYWPGPSANSEPESRALVDFLKAEPPKFILSLHSWKPMLNINGPCREEAAEIAAHTGYEIVESIGYPTPGCLGTYAGLERNMPTLTYEIERGLQAEPILAIHVPAILEGLKVTEKRG